MERFDRKLSEDRTWWLRLPQEDFCQATGTPPALKYENEGGPGIRRIMDLLLGSERATADRRNFMKSQLVFWVLAGIHGHAKNFSVFLLPGGGFRLTPRYDVLSAHSMLGNGRSKLPSRKVTMAMALEGKNRHYAWSSIRLRRSGARPPRRPRDYGRLRRRSLRARASRTRQPPSDSPIDQFSRRTQRR